jgi:hypothetical protein
MPLRYSLVEACLVGILAAGVSPAAAAIPNPSSCSFPSQLVACPAGDIGFTVVVRDLGNIPISGSTVTLNFSSCAAVQFCTGCCDGVTLDLPGRTASRATDANGVVTLRLKLGGVCNGQYVTVRADGYLIAMVPVASPDQDGDLVVDSEDAAHVFGLIGTSDPGADFVQDNIITQADYDWLVNQHDGHSCDGVVSARHPSWGVLKLFYR